MTICLSFRKGIMLSQDSSNNPGIPSGFWRDTLHTHYNFFLGCRRWMPCTKCCSDRQGPVHWEQSRICGILPHQIPGHFGSWSNCWRQTPWVVKRRVPEGCSSTPLSLFCNDLISSSLYWDNIPIYKHYILGVLYLNDTSETLKANIRYQMQVHIIMWERVLFHTHSFFDKVYL